jgi:hypothetical protein
MMVGIRHRASGIGHRASGIGHRAISNEQYAKSHDIIS